MSKRKKGIYVTHGKKPMLVGYKVVIDGVPALAYIKDNKIVCYEPWDKICRQFAEEPCCSYIRTHEGKTERQAV